MEAAGSGKLPAEVIVDGESETAPVPTPTRTPKGGLRDSIYKASALSGAGDTYGRIKSTAAKDLGLGTLMESSDRSAPAQVREPPLKR